MATKPINGVVFEAADGRASRSSPARSARRWTGRTTTQQDHVQPSATLPEAMETTLFLRLVDQGKLLDDTVSKWYPQYPNADKVTLRMLASSTSNPDFVTSEEFVTKFDADPFKHWTPRRHSTSR